MLFDALAIRHAISCSAPTCHAVNERAAYVTSLTTEYSLSIPCRIKTHISSPKLLDWLRNRPNLLFNGYHNHFSPGRRYSGRGVHLTDQSPPYTVDDTTGTKPPLPHIHLWVTN